MFIGLKRKPSVFTVFSVLLLLVFTSCATGANENIYKAYQDFILIKTQTGDTLSSLAQKYLSDPSAGWIIAEFNQIKEVTPGADLIIPTAPFKRGGLKAKGLQVVPVLAYSNFSKFNGDKNSVSEDVFEAQMKYLRDNGYQVIGLDQLLDFMEFKKALPEKSVAITIDNGWRTTYDIAYPILKKYGFKATLFVYTDLIGNKRGLEWEHLLELSKNGFEIESQSKTNRDLTKPDKEDSFKTYYKTLEKELSYPKQILQEKLKKECSYLAYPYGTSNNLIIALAKKYGYRGAFTTQRSSNPLFTNPYLINRTTVNGDDDPVKFKEYLTVFQNKEL
jgi:peptidoglycan/xylan/chitin deacetylase (PgdA/CDA1 family)